MDVLTVAMGVILALSFLNFMAGISDIIDDQARFSQKPLVAPVAPRTLEYIRQDRRNGWVRAVFFWTIAIALCAVNIGLGLVAVVLLVMLGAPVALGNWTRRKRLERAARALAVDHVA
jgi:hypothetical protein